MQRIVVITGRGTCDETVFHYIVRGDIIFQQFREYVGGLVHTVHAIDGAPLCTLGGWAQMKARFLHAGCIVIEYHNPGIALTPSA